jgi:quinol monooxygenase YgiN
MAMARLVGLAEFTMAEAPAEEIEAVVDAMVAAVVEEEPGTLVYAWYRHVDEPNRWTVLEVYADEVAQQAHLKGPKVRAASKPLGTLIDMEQGGGFRMEAIAGKGVA